MSRRVVLGLAPGLLVAVAAWWWFAGRAPATPVVGRSAPDFKLASLDGAELSLGGYRGRPVIVNFWATWCEPCKQEMPDLQAQAAANKDLTILGVDTIESAVVVKLYVQQLGIDFPIVLDQDGSVMDEYQVIGMPTSFFIDRSGVLRGMYRGALTPDALRENLATIL